MPKARPKAKSLLPKEKEKDIQSGIIEGASYLGWRLWHFDAGAVRKASHGELAAHSGVPPKDWPDLFGLTNWGQAVAFEIKRPGQKPREGQLAILAGLQKLGAIVGVFSDIEDAITFIKDVIHVHAQSKTGFSSQRP